MPLRSSRRCVRVSGAGQIPAVNLGATFASIPAAGASRALSVGSDRTSAPTSPLRKGESVEIRKMAPEHSCSADMLVMTRWSNRNLAVPLCHLKPIGVDEPTKQAIEDWHY